MDKFQRSYRIEIDLESGETIIVTMPLTIKFSVKRHWGASLNEMNLSIYNLSRRLRDQIFQDFFNSERRKEVRLYAGYENLSLLFQGDIWEAYSSREDTDIVTNIYSKTGVWDINNSYTYTTIGAGKTVREVLDFLIGQFTSLERGAVGEFPDVLQRPVVLNGNTYELLKKYSNGRAWIDNNRVYVMNDDEVVHGGLPVIDKNSGILSTPRRTAGMLNVLMLFDPRLLIGQKVELKSSVEPIFNGVYSVHGLIHQGVISGAESGQCTTAIDMLVGGDIFRQVG